MAEFKGRFSPFWKQCFVTGAVCSDVIAHGCIVGYPAVLLPQLDGPGSAIPLTEDDASWIASVLGISMLIGIVITPPIMGRLGRKIAHYIVILPVLLAWIMFTLATTVKELIIARTLQGLSYGIFTSLRSILIGEYTSPKYRGAFLTAISLAQGFGIMIVHFIGSCLSWQQTSLVCVLFPFTSLVMTIYSPESPSWLADRGRYDDCRKVFRWLRGYNEEKELEEMIEARIVAKKPEYGNHFKTLSATVKKKEFYKPISVMIHTYCMMAFSGCHTLAAFSTTIIYLIIGRDADADFWMITLDIQRIVTSAISIYVMHRTKRRTMMFATLGLCILSHLFIAAYTYAKSYGLMHYTAQWLPVLLISIHYVSVGIGMVPLPVSLAGEIFPLSYRSIGGSISVAFYSGFMFIVLQTFSGLTENLGLHGTYLVYAGILSYIWLMLCFCLPETKGKTLQQIENEFKGLSTEFEDVEVTRSLQRLSQTQIR